MKDTDENKTNAIVKKPRKTQIKIYKKHTKTHAKKRGDEFASNRI